MGVPAFYRWLVETHPRAVSDVIEDKCVYGVNSSLPNPNGIEFDNLYLDMNGIIHPCFHPQDVPSAPTSYDEVFVAVFKYIDRIFSMIRPRKLLYLAIDGVAPRAKMNQQRARRFKAAKDAVEENSGEESEKRNKDEKFGKLTRPEPHDKLDSNVITPGTEFMSLLSSALRYYVHLKMNEDPGWKDIKVIVSDASVPGEGEHKIMSYIRLQRNLSGFDPNTRHCLYGLDADLIMLALASHEIHFSILRENAIKQPEFGKSARKRGRSYSNHAMNMEDYIEKQKFQFFHVWVLRDYLMHELRIADRTVEIDLERLIDDFVFMCMFVGNDFLPNMPSLQISEGALDLLMKVYKAEFVQMGGYLTDSCKVNLERVQHFLRAVGSYENVIFKKRNQVKKQKDMRFGGSSRHSRPGKTKGSTNNASGNVEPVIDQIKLEEEGWKERYYAQKFEAKTNDELERIRKHTVLKYVEGICWNMHYYYEGVCSWQWFYPYHYAPFASDFHDLDKLPIEFTLGMPFKPLDQLMAVLPAASAHALPRSYRELMTDPSSPILDFYPSDFELDMNGKRFSWQAICKLPFIEESRLLRELEKVEHTLTDEEKHRNSLGLDMLFVHKSHPLAEKIFSFRLKSKDHPKLHEAKVKQKINPTVSDGMNGFMYVSDNPVCPEQIDPPIDSMPMISENKVLAVFYKYPSFHPHIPRLPKGVIVPSKSVSKKDVFSPPVLWHEKSSIPGRIFLERRTTKFISSRRLAISAHHLVSMLQTQGSNGLADRTSVGDVKPIPNQKSTDSENDINCEGKASDRGGEFTEECTKTTGDVWKIVSSMKSVTMEKEINGKRKEPDAIVSKKRTNREVSGVSDVEPTSNLKSAAPENEINGEGKASDKGGLSNEECDSRTGNDHVEPVQSMKPTKSEMEIIGERKESDAIVSRKRKRCRNRSKKAFDSSTGLVTPMSNQKEPDSVKKVNGEVKVSDLDDAILMPKQKVPASGHKENEGNELGLEDLAPIRNQKAPASNKEAEEEGKVLVVVRSKKRKCKARRPENALTNGTIVADVAFVSNQKPSDSEKEVSGEGNEAGTIASAKSVALEPNQTPIALMREVNGEEENSGAIASKKRKRRRTNQKPSDSLKEVIGEGNESGTIASAKSVALVPNQTPIALMKEVNGEEDKPSDSEKAVNGERNESGTIASAKSVALQTPIALMKEVHGEEENAGAITSKKRKRKRKNQKPSNSQKEVDGERKEYGVIPSKKSLALVPNQTSNTPNKSISGERNMSFDKSPSLSLLQVLMTGQSCLQNQIPTVSEQEIDNDGEKVNS